MSIAAQLRDEARAVNERRMLVLTGSQENCRAGAVEAIHAVGISANDAVYVGDTEPVSEELNGFTHVPPSQYKSVLGLTWEAAIIDCHARCEPNILGALTGAVSGGGLLILLVPPLSEWSGRRDTFDETLAVPPHTVEEVGEAFRARLIETLRSHRGIAIVDVDTDTILKEGLTNPAPRYATEQISPSTEHAFPESAYGACLTQDQSDALFSLEGLIDDESAVVLEADRGRGKSSVAGLAAASLAIDGADILVTASKHAQTAELFERAASYLESVSVAFQQDATTINLKEGGAIRYVLPQTVIERSETPECLIVDEAAGLPVETLNSLLSCNRIAFLTTVHGYEGTGRGFAIRFRDRLAQSRHTVTDFTIDEPIRYASADPIEVWSFRTLCLNGRPPVKLAISDATLETVSYRELSSTELRENEQLLQELFGLLVLAHYHTEPNDLARLLDAPNISVHALLSKGHPVSVALLAGEGGVSEQTCAAMYEGQRVRGNLLPDVLASQLRDESAPRLRGKRVLRIATHEALRSHGFGSSLLEEVHNTMERRQNIDWLGVGFGATPQLVSFWRENGFRTVHFATSRNDRSGEHSALMLDPLSSAGDRLLSRHTDWFFNRLPATLTDSLSEIEPDIVRAICRATATQFEPQYSSFEKRILAGLGNGAAIFETAPRPTRQLTLQYLTDPQFAGVQSVTRLVSDRAERLLVRKALQAQSWETVRDTCDYHSRSESMRALGEAVETLVAAYSDPTIQADRERLQK